MSPETEARLERIERLLLLQANLRTLPPDLRQLAVEARAEAVKPREGLSGRERGRAEIALAEFNKLAKCNGPERTARKFPRELVRTTTIDRQTGEIVHPRQLDVVPLSLLVNRCTQRQVFRPRAGDVGQREAVLDAIRDAGLVVATLDRAGLRPDGETPVVFSHAEAVRHGLVEGEIEEESTDIAPQVVEPKRPKIKFNIG